MFRISSNQMKALSDSTRRAYEKRAIKALLEIFPSKEETLGADGMLMMVQEGIDRSRRYGIKNQSEVFMYTALMLTIGGRFDEDQLIPWASSILSNNTNSSSDKISRLYKAAVFYTNATYGADGSFFLNALNKICCAKHSDFYEMMRANDPIGSIVQKLEHFYPEKSAFIGTDILMRWVCKEIEISQAGRSETRVHVDRFLYLILMFLWGSEFTKDPQLSNLASMTQKSMSGMESIDLFEITQEHARCMLEDRPFKPSSAY